MPWIKSKRETPCAECGDDIELEDDIYFNGRPYCKVCGVKEAEDDRLRKTKQRASDIITAQTKFNR